MLELHKTHKSSVDQDSMTFCQNTKILRHILILFTTHSLRNPVLECYSISVQTNVVTLQQTEKFNYLGDTFSSDGRYNNKLDTRIRRAICINAPALPIGYTETRLIRKKQSFLFSDQFLLILSPMIMSV